MKERIEYKKHLNNLQLDEWRHPLMPHQNSVFIDKGTMKNIVNPKEDVNFWIAQFAYQFKAMYEINDRQIADILLLSNVKKINRAQKKYPRVMYKSMEELETDLKKGGWQVGKNGF